MGGSQFIGAPKRKILSRKTESKKKFIDLEDYLVESQTKIEYKRHKDIRLIYFDENSREKKVAIDEIKRNGKAFRECYFRGPVELANNDITEIVEIVGIQNDLKKVLLGSPISSWYLNSRLPYEENMNLNKLIQFEMNRLNLVREFLKNEMFHEVDAKITCGIFYQDREKNLSGNYERVSSSNIVSKYF